MNVLLAPGTGERSLPWLNGVRPRTLICLLAALLALVRIDVTPNFGAAGQNSDYSTVVAINGTRINLTCQGSGPGTIAIVDTAAVASVIDDSVRSQLARSVRLCTIEVLEATARTSDDLIRLLPVTLFGQKLSAPYVIISLASISTAFDEGDQLPFHERIGGFVLIDSGPPATGLAARTDGTNWPLPAGDEDRIALAILSLFWPPDEG